MISISRKALMAVVLVGTLPVVLRNGNCQLAMEIWAGLQAQLDSQQE